MNSSADNDNSNAAENSTTNSSANHQNEEASVAPAENALLLQPTVSTSDHTSDGFQRLQTEINQMYVRDEANLNNGATVINSSRRPLVYRYSINIIGSRNIGDQRDSQVGTLADPPNIVTSTAITDNYDHDFPPLESIRRPQTINGNYEHNFPPLGSVWRSRMNRQSVSIGNNMNLGGQRDNQVVSNIVTATANNDNYDRDNSPFESIWRSQIYGESTSDGSSNMNLGVQSDSQLETLAGTPNMVTATTNNDRIPQINRQSTSTGNDMNLGGQLDSQVETLVDTSNIVTATANIDNFEHFPLLESISRPQINGQPMSIGSSNMNLGRQQESQVETLADNIDIATAIDNFERDNPLLENIWGPQINRRSMSIGSSNMNLGGQPDSRLETLADTPNIVTSAGDQAHLQRAIAANVARNNSSFRGTIPGSWPPQDHGQMIFDSTMMDSVRSTSPFHQEQVLNHGFNHSLVSESQIYPLAGATLNNNRNAVPYQPHAFHDHMIPYNTNASSSNIAQTSQGINQNYSSRLRSEFQENRQIRLQNASPYNRLNVHPREVFRPQESLFANQPVWEPGAMAAIWPGAAVSVPNVSAVHTDMHQGYVNNVGGTSRHPFPMPPLGSGAGRTAGQNQSGAVNSSGQGHARFRRQRQPAPELELGNRAGPSHHPEVLRQSAVRDDSSQPDSTAIFPTPEPRRMEPQPTTHEPEAYPYRQRAIGVNCSICRRDLSFTPSGPISQPLNPPPAAVLPCHHVYHAECLRNITGRDQENNPPCIACALATDLDSNS